MAEPTVVQALGLQTSPNELGNVPAGGLVKAENCVMLAPGVVGSRRGQPPLAYAPGDYPHALGLFGDTLLVNTDTYTLEYDSGSAFVAYDGTFTPPDESVQRMKFMEAAGCTYLTTDDGVFRLDVKENTPVLSGGPRNWQIKETSGGSLIGTTGFLPDGSGVAYRVVFGVKDATGRIHLGVPSGRFVVDNDDGGARNVALDIVATNAADLLAAGAFWQLYRSRSAASFQTNEAGVVVYVPPSDEMFLVQEAYFNRDILGGGGLTIVDTTPDGALVSPLYTNQTEETALQQNDCPPLSHDIVQWDSRAWFANTRRYPQLILQIVGVGEGQDGFTGIRVGDQLTVLGETLTAAANYSVADKTFEIFTSGTYDENIYNTAQSLVTLVNALNIGRAQLLFDPVVAPNSDPPGKILFQSENLDDAEWNASLTTKKIAILSGGLVRSGGHTVEVTCDDDHGLVAGDTVRVEPTGTADANFAAGTYTVLGSGLTGTVFRYTDPPLIDPAGANVASVQAYNERRLTPEPQYAWNPPPPPSVFSVAVGGLERDTNVVTVTTDVPHNLSVGMQVAIEPVAAADANFAKGTYEVTSTPSSTTFTYGNSGADAVSTTAYQSGARVTADAYGGLAGPSFLAFSKTDQPEAAPAVNAFGVGAPDKAILRIVPLENYLFVFKQDAVFVVSPTGGSYRVDPLDTTLHVYAADSVASVQGKIYALTNQGVVALTSSGYRIVSGPIEQDLFQYFGPSLASVRTAAFGVSRETDRAYELWLPSIVDSDEEEVRNPRAYVYSTQGPGAWTTSELDRYCGLVRVSDDATFYGSNTTGDVFRESNTKTAADYADEILTGYVITDWDPDTRILSVADESATIAAGDAVVRDADSLTPAFGPLIIASESGGTNMTLAGTADFVVSTAATGTITVTGISPDVDVNDINFTGAGASNRLAAIALAAAITGDPDSGVTAEVRADPSAIIDLTALVPGTAGNAIGLVANNDASVSDDTLTGGVDSLVNIAKAIPIDLEWRTVTANSPADPKTYRQIHVHHRKANYRKGTLAFASDLVRTQQTVSVYPDAALSSDGSVAVPDYTVNLNLYPGMPTRPVKLWCGVPQAVAKAAYMSVAWQIREAYAVWWLNGFSLVEVTAGDKGAR